MYFRLFQRLAYLGRAEPSGRSRGPRRRRRWAGRRPGTPRADARPPALRPAPPRRLSDDRPGGDQAQSGDDDTAFGARHEKLIDPSQGSISMAVRSRGCPPESNSLPSLIIARASGIRAATLNPTQSSDFSPGFEPGPSLIRPGIFASRTAVADSRRRLGGDVQGHGPRLVRLPVGLGWPRSAASASSRGPGPWPGRARRATAG